MPKKKDSSFKDKVEKICDYYGDPALITETNGDITALFSELPESVRTESFIVDCKKADLRAQMISRRKFNGKVHTFVRVFK